MEDPTRPGESVGRLSDQDAARLTAEIEGLTRGAQPLPSGLRALGQEQPSERLRQVLDALARSLEAGMPLDAAIAEQGDRLPGHLRGLVAVGAKTGKLGEVLGRVVGYRNIGPEITRVMWLSLAYPIMSLGLALTLLAFVSFLVVRTYSQIFADFGIRMSRVTMAMIQFAQWYGAAWRLIAGAVLAALLIVLVVRLVLKPPARRSLACRVPLVGWVWRWTSLAEFCHLLGLLLESQVPLAGALSLASDGVQDADIDKACQVMAREVEGGRSLADSIAQRRLFPAGLAQILRWAEGHRGLAEVLHVAGEMFEARARAQASFVSTFCSIMAVLVILSGILVAIAGILLPMLTMINILQS